MWATCTADWKVGDSSPGGPSPCAGVHLDKEVKDISDILGRKGARIKEGSARLRSLSTDHGAGILLQVKLFVPVTIYIVPEILPSETLSNNQPTNQHSPHAFSIGFLTKYLLIWHKISYISNGLFSSPEPKAQVSYCHSAPSVVRPSVNFNIFNFFSETAERNSTKLDRMQDLNVRLVLYQVCVFRAGRKKQDGRPGLWLTETFSTSSLKSLNGIQRNLTGSKISMSSTFVRVHIYLMESCKAISCVLLGCNCLTLK